MMTTYTATITKVKDAEPLGTYVPTSVDEAKAKADGRILYVDSGTFTVQTDLVLKGRGIKPYSSGYYVTRLALEKLQQTYNIVPDF